MGARGFEGRAGEAFPEVAFPSIPREGPRSHRARHQHDPQGLQARGHYAQFQDSRLKPWFDFPAQGNPLQRCGDIANQSETTEV